jgi:hypothetical protein
VQSYAEKKVPRWVTHCVIGRLIHSREKYSEFVRRDDDISYGRSTRNVSRPYVHFTASPNSPASRMKLKLTFNFDIQFLNALADTFY